jgi:hypothetical protein
LAPGVAYHVPGDHELLDLCRPLIDPEQAHIAVEALDSVFLQIAGSAVYLDCSVGDTADHLGREKLGKRLRPFKFRIAVLYSISKVPGLPFAVKVNLAYRYFDEETLGPFHQRNARRSP